MEKWKQLEQVVAHIQQTIAPHATVRHNERVGGRQLDVTVRQAIGSEELFIVVECKDEKRPISVQKVEQFAGLLQAVYADRGIMVSSSNYTRSARRRADEFRITLFSYQDATTFDWSRLFGENSLMYFVSPTLELIEFVSFVDEAEDEEPFDGSARLRTATGENLGTYDSVMAPLKQQICDSRQFPLGEYGCQIDLGGTIQMDTPTGPRTIEKIEFRIKKTAHRYTTIPRVTSGHVLMDKSGNFAYREYENQINWLEVTESQPGISLTAEEYARGTDEPASDLPFHVHTAEKDGVLSVRLRDKSFRKPM